MDPCRQQSPFPTSRQADFDDARTFGPRLPAILARRESGRKRPRCRRGFCFWPLAQSSAHLWFGRSMRAKWPAIHALDKWRVGRLASWALAASVAGGARALSGHDGVAARLPAGRRGVLVVAGGIISSRDAAGKPRLTARPHSFLRQDELRRRSIPRGAPEPTVKRGRDD